MLRVARNSPHHTMQRIKTMKLHQLGALGLLASPVLLFGLAACGSGEDSGGGEGGGLGVTVTEEHRTLAKNQFDTYCMPCHGASGKGDGIAGASLNPKPRDWTDATWQDSVDDAHIAKTIAEGGPSVGLSPLMAPNPTYKDNKEVIAALVEIVRGYKGK